MGGFQNLQQRQVSRFLLQGPIDKFKVRVKEIQALNLPDFKAVKQYVSRAISTPAYVAQLVPPPPRFKELELDSVNKVLGSQ